MKAVQFVVSIPRYLLTRGIGIFYSPIYWSALACLQYRDVTEPELPNEEWAKIKVKYAGICGSDINLIYLRDSPFASPFTSSSFTMGHENLGTILELGNKVDGFNIGDRVVVDLLLPCPTRGIDQLCNFCQCGEFSRCENFAEGILSPGLIIGTCHDTGGSWSPCFVAHKSQLFRVPDNISDEDAILVDPFCSALHAVMRNFPNDEDVILVVGAGVIGLCMMVALRALGSKAKVIVLAKYDFQGQLAQQYGADDVIYLQRGNNYYEAIALSVKGKLYKPIFGKQILVSGADMVFECVGTDESIDDALRFTRSGGKMVLVGLAAIPRKIDWTPIWLNELEVIGSFACSTEEYKGQRLRSYQIALDLMADGKVDLAPLLTHKFNLVEYRKAIATTASKSENRVVKTAFVFD
jgi:L-iditol 2-dehydrogenase